MSERTQIDRADAAGAPSDYRSYLKSPEWVELHRKAYLRAGGLCEFCGALAEHAHHVVYPKQFKDDALHNLIAVCERCHRLCHGIRDLPIDDIWETETKGRVFDTRERRQWLHRRFFEIADLIKDPATADRYSAHLWARAVLLFRGLTLRPREPGGTPCYALRDYLAKAGMDPKFMCEAGFVAHGEDVAVPFDLYEMVGTPPSPDVLGRAP